MPALAGRAGPPVGQVPVLRLPWPADALPPGGLGTEVRLPLRPGRGRSGRAALADVWTR